jgi:UDP-N-acetylglucosamine 1-carboxyvinyltransferase
MHQFIIEGGHKLSGTLKAGGNKNAAIKMLPACLLTDEPVTLYNMPDIGDVRTTIEIMERLGVEITWEAPNTLRVHAREIRTTTLDAALAQKIRASIVFAGPMLARCGEVTLAVPGGDSIGERRLDTHTYALQKLGATIDYQRNALVMQSDGLQGADILLMEASVTATENALMAAVTAKGTSTIRNAACEPHIQNLCEMLTKMGAQIEGIGTNQLRFEVVNKLKGCEIRVGADYM